MDGADAGGERGGRDTGQAAAPGPQEDDSESEAESSRVRRQGLTWEVTMMLESSRKLMAKCRDSSCFHFPLPEVIATLATGPLT